MITIDELKFTKNRLDTLVGSSDNVEERAIGKIISDSLKNLIQQMEMFSQTPNFKDYVSEYEKSEKEKEQ